MSPRTLFLSRLIGLYCILIGLSMMTHSQATVETVTALLQNPSMTLILGVITLGAGLVMVLAHNNLVGRYARRRGQPHRSPPIIRVTIRNCCRQKKSYDDTVSWPHSMDISRTVSSPKRAPMVNII